MVRRGNILVFVLVGTLLVAVVGLAGYFYWQNGITISTSANPPTNQSKFPSISPGSAKPPEQKPKQATPSADPTANWSLFTEPHGRFTVKYPNNLKSQSELVFHGYPGEQKPSKEDRDRFSGILYNTVPFGDLGQPEELHISFGTYYGSMQQSESVKDFIFRLTHYRFADPESITIGSRNSWTSLAVWGGGGVANLGAFIPKGDGVNILVTLETNYEASSKDGISADRRTLFKQILSSFKFL